MFLSSKNNTSIIDSLDILNLHIFLIKISLIIIRKFENIFQRKLHYYFLTQERIKYIKVYLGYLQNFFQIQINSILYPKKKNKKRKKKVKKKQIEEKEKEKIVEEKKKIKIQ